MAMGNFVWSKTERTNYYLNGGHFPLKQVVLGMTPIDRAVVWNLAVSYEEPFFATAHGIKGQVLGGWNASATMNYQSGQTYNITGLNWTGANVKPKNRSYSHWFNKCAQKYVAQSSSDQAPVLTPIAGTCGTKCRMKGASASKSKLRRADVPNQDSVPNR